MKLLAACASVSGMEGATIMVVKFESQLRMMRQLALALMLMAAGFQGCASDDDEGDEAVDSSEVDVDEEGADLADDGANPLAQGESLASGRGSDSAVSDLSGSLKSETPVAGLGAGSDKAAAPAPVPAQPSFLDYKVAHGDWLSKIARRFYGNAHDYEKIIAANPDIKNPNLIYPGQVFRIPLDTPFAKDAAQKLMASGAAHYSGSNAHAGHNPSSSDSAHGHSSGMTSSHADMMNTPSSANVPSMPAAAPAPMPPAPSAAGSL